MARADGSLSAIQFEIMTIVWDNAPKSVSITEVWKEIAKNRKVVRSTIQNTMERLAADGWLNRRPLKSGLRFRAAVARDEALEVTHRMIHPLVMFTNRPILQPSASVAGETQTVGREVELPKQPAAPAWTFGVPVLATSPSYEDQVH